MKKLLALLTIGLATLAFAQEKTTLSVAVYPDLDSVIEAVLPQFQEANPDIDVELRVLAHGDHHNALVTALATGSGAADVVAIDVEFIAKFVSEGGLTDLSEAPFEASALQDQFASYAWTQASTTDGRQVAIPTDLGPGVMYYRRDLLQEADTPLEQVTESWDTYLDYGRQVSRDTNGDGRNDVFLVANAGDVARAIYQADIPEGQGVFFNADGEPVIDSARFRDAFAVAKTIREEELDAQIEAWTNEWYEGFKSGTVATQLSGAWLLGHLQNWMAPDTAGLWGAANTPNGVYVSWGGSFYGIPEQSQNKEAAWKLVQFLTDNPQAQLAALDVTGAFPALTSVYDDETFAQPIAFLDGQPARELFATVAQNIEGTATNPNDVVALEIVDTALSQVLSEGRDIDSALAEAQRLVERRTRR